MLNFNFTRIFVLLAIFCNSSVGAFPEKIIGIFKSNTSAPAIAAEIAVEDVSSTNPSLNFSYSMVPESNFLQFDETRIKVQFKSALAITGSPHVCERLASLLPQGNGYLVCYGPPTKATLEKWSTTKNVFLSHPNPEAMVPCVYKMIQKLNETQEQRPERSSHIAVSLILDRNHTSRQVKNTLVSNLSNGNFTVNKWWLEDAYDFSSFPAHKDNSGVHVVVSTVHGLAARCLLCEVYRRKSCGENVFLIFLGRSSKDWMDFSELPKEVKDMNKVRGTIGRNISCGKEQLLAAAEGHFLLEFPTWDETNELASRTKRVRMEIQRRLFQNGKHIFRDYYTEAPLAYDSVMNMAQAISRSISSLENESHGPSEVLQRELNKSFIGVSGEFSFRDDRLRSGNKATVIMSRFENGTYVKVGKHFNANNSFFPHLAEVFSDPVSAWNGTTLGECEPPAPVCGIGLWMALVLLLLTTLAVLCFIGFLMRRLCSKQHI